MIQSYKSKCFCMVDNGLFIELAIKLSQDVGRMLYYSPWKSGFPKSNSRLVGVGVLGLERVDNLFDVIPEVDCFVFPDVYDGDLQLHLDDLGKRVWGSRHGDDLELYRDESKKLLQKHGIEVGKWEVVKGIADLRKYLQEHDDRWIKVSLTRGDFETFHSPNYKLIEPKLDELEHNLGAKKKTLEFIVEEAINDAVETGYDGYSVDGEFPSVAMAGIEVKDKGYVAMLQAYDDLPDEIRAVNDKMAPILKSYRYRNFFSSEIRITKDHHAHVIDPCCRMGSPPNELYQEMFENLPDIIWYGAEGTVIDPEFSHGYGAELLIHSQWADQNWLAIGFPEKYRDNVKLRNLTIIDGQYYAVPQVVGLPEIGAVVACADSMEDAIGQVKEIAEQLEGYFLDVFPDALDEGEAEIKKLESFGIKFHKPPEKGNDSMAIDIKKSHKGMFTKKAHAAGMSVSAYAKKEAHNPKAPAKLKKEAVFAENAEHHFRPNLGRVGKR